MWAHNKHTHTHLEKSYRIGGSGENPVFTILKQDSPDLKLTPRVCIKVCVRMLPSSSDTFWLINVIGSLLE